MPSNESVAMLCPEPIVPSEVLAMAFVNFQPIEGRYDPARGFAAGTLFPDLAMPLTVGGDCR